MNQSLFKKFINWTKLKFKIHICKNINFYFKERDIWWASLGINIGYEQDGKNKEFERPVLVLKKFNKDMLWILPLSSKVKDNKFYFTTRYNNKNFSIILSQLKLISSKRLTRKIRILPKNEFSQIKEKIKNFLL